MLLGLITHPHLVQMGLIILGAGIFIAAWNTEDEMWTMWYWIDRLRGIERETEIHLAQQGGLERAKVLAIAVALVILGIAWPTLMHWMAPGTPPAR